MPTPLRTSSPALCGLLILASYLGVISKCWGPPQCSMRKEALGALATTGPCRLQGN